MPTTSEKPELKTATPVTETDAHTLTTALPHSSIDTALVVTREEKRNEVNSKQHTREETGVDVKSEGVMGECEVVEESGPVQYCEEEEEMEEEEGYGDEEMDELAYEGDPLLQSDHEDGKSLKCALTAI